MPPIRVPLAIVVALVAGLCVATAPARAQNVDIAVETVQVTPTSVKVNDVVTVLATLRRLDPPSANARPIDVLVQLFVDDAKAPISTQTVTLRPGEAVNVRTQWKATEGKREFRATIVRLSAKSGTPRDVRPSNDEARSAPIVVAAAEPPSRPPANASKPSEASRPSDPSTPSGTSLAAFRPITVTTEALGMAGTP